MNTQEPQHTTMVNLTIDGTQVRVPKGTTVYNAAKELGIEIPIFCYLDRMPPFGACRMCLVEVEKMGKLQTSCTLEATEGMVVKTQSAMAAEGRKDILELLLINHPLDCPICDKGGECPLQNNAYKYGPGKSRFYEVKRQFKKPLPMSPVLMLDRERCIICARCTRFSDIVSGDHALEFIERGYKTEVGTPDGLPAESKFIGNTIMICPVGALTSRPYRFKARPWDNATTESTCTLCPVGCSLLLDARDGQVVRTRSCENRSVNDIWLCDKGWFGYEFAASANRMQKPLIRRNGRLEPATWDEAITLIADKLKEAKLRGKIAAFGGNPLTVEENYRFQKLMRIGIGINNIDHRIGTPILKLDEEGMPPGMEMYIGDCEKLSYAIFLGFDITEEFPIIWLRLKHAINNGAKILFLGHYAPEVAQHLTEVILHPPGKEIDSIKKHQKKLSEFASKGGKGAIFLGKQYLASSQRASIISEAVQFAQTLPDCVVNIMEGRGNSMGARIAGMHPEMQAFGKAANRVGLDAGQVIQTAAEEGWDILYVAGADPAVKFPSKLWNEARSKLGFLVVQDLFLTRTAQQADVVLPTLCYMEKAGSFLNIEGRVQRILPGKSIPDGIYGDGEIFTLLAHKLSVDLNIEKSFYDSLQTDNILKGKGTLSVKPSESKPEKPVDGPDTLLATFAPFLFDQGMRMKNNPHLIKMAKEPFVRIHESEGRKRNIKTGDKVRIEANGSAISGKVKLDNRVAEGTLLLPLGFDELPVHDLALNLVNGLSVKIKLVNET